MQIDPSNLLKIVKDQLPDSSAKFVGCYTIEPRQQIYFRLGTFSATSPPESVWLHLTPDTSIENTIVTHITAIEDGETYCLALHIANFDSIPVYANLWQKINPASKFAKLEPVAVTIL